MVDNITVNGSLDNDSASDWWFDFDDDFYNVHLNRLELAPACILPFLIVPGLLLNILAFTILVRRQMSLEHEGFVYLGSIQLVSIVVVAYDLIPLWISTFGQSRNVRISSDASCKTMIYLDHVLVSASGWLVVAMLFGVYLRRCGSRIVVEKKICGCREFPAKFCTLFGAGFTTVSIFVQLGIGNLWVVPFIEFVDMSVLQYCHIDLPPSYALWLFLIERLPLLVLTPVLLIALGYLSLEPGEHGVPLCNTAEESSSSNAQDFNRAAIGVALATVLLKSPLFILKSLLPVDVIQQQHLNRFDMVLFLLTLLSYLSMVVAPVVCLAMISGMRETLASVTGRNCSGCRRDRKIDP